MKKRVYFTHVIKAVSGLIVPVRFYSNMHTYKLKERSGRPLQ